MELTGRILTDEGFQPATVRFGRRITAVEPAIVEDGPMLVPGFVDLHVHGGGGGDVMGGEQDLRAACRFHAGRGTTALVATTMTAPLEDLERALLGVRALRERPEPDAAEVLGAHLEGPWISPDRLGAQPPHARPPETWEVERLLELAPVLIVTLAPEVPGCDALIERLVGAGVRVQIGHSDASAAAAIDALERGAQGFTHLFNAMSGLHQRRPGVVGAALACGEEAELIVDGLHVDPVALRAAWRALPRWYAVSDSLVAAGLVPGEYPLGTRTMRCDGAACRLADGTLAGSVCTLDRALRRLVELGLDPAEAARRVSTVPARVAGVGDHGRIAVGCVADLVQLDAELRVRRVWIGGRERPSFG